MMKSIQGSKFLVFACASLFAMASPADSIDIREQPLPGALREFSDQTGLQLAYVATLARNKTSPGTQGRTDPDAALSELLEGTELEHQYVNSTTVAIGSARKAASRSRRATAGAAAVPQPVLMASRQQSSRAADDTNENGDADAQADEGGMLELPDLRVTGSRLATAAGQRINNVIVLTADDLARFGEATLERVLRQLPQNVGGVTEFGGANNTGDTTSGLGSRFGLGRLNGTANVSGASTINLRGLGERATLILVDGKRIGASGMLGGFSDISDIPLALVERVEILLDGASAIYGPDAIGGVVNVILRKDFQGVHASLRHTAPTGGGFSEQTFSLSGSYGWDSGSLTATLDYFRTSSQDATRSGIDFARPHAYFTDYGTIRAQRSFGNPDEEISPALTQAGIDAGTIGAGEVITVASVPTGQDGTGLTLADFLATANNPMLDEALETGLSLIPGSTRYNVRLDLSQEIGGGMELTAALQFAPRDTTSTNPHSRIDFQMPSENPANPISDVPLVRVSKKIAGFPDAEIEANGQNWTADLALDGTFGGWLSEWEWHAGVRHSRNELETTIRNELRSDEIQAALSGETLLDEGVYVGYPRRPRKDGLFLNPFGESLQAVNPADMLAGFVRPTQVNDTLTELTTINGYVRGDIARLPAGNMQLVAGVEYRDQFLGFSFRTTDTARTLVTNGANIVGFRNADTLEELEASRDTRAVYMELYTPLVGDLPGVQLLSATLAGRYESSGKWSYRTWQAGAAWQVIPGFRFRGSKATSFVTPALLTSAPVTVPPSTPWLLIDHGSFVFGSTAQIIEGANPDLQPEHGTVYSYGLEWTPVFASGFSGLTIGVGFSHSTIFDRINSPPLFGFFAVVNETLEARFPDVVERDAEGNITRLDVRAVNLAFEERSSVDARLGYRVDTRFGHFGARINVSRNRYHNTLHSQHDAELDPDALDRLVGEIIPEDSQRAAFYWEDRGMRLGLNFHHRSETRFEDGDRRQIRSVPPLVTNFFGSYDFAAGLFTAPGFLRNVVVDFGVNNVARKFTRRVVDGEDDNSRFTGLFNNSRGRTYYVQIRTVF